MDLINSWVNLLFSFYHFKSYCRYFAFFALLVPFPFFRIKKTMDRKMWNLVHFLSGVGAVLVAALESHVMNVGSRSKRKNYTLMPAVFCCNWCINHPSICRGGLSHENGGFTWLSEHFSSSRRLIWHEVGWTFSIAPPCIINSITDDVSPTI